MAGFDDLFKPFDDIIEDDEPQAVPVEEEVWGNTDSWNSGKQQDIWNNNDGWNTDNCDDNPEKDYRNIFKNEHKDIGDANPDFSDFDEEDEDDEPDAEATEIALDELKFTDPELWDELALAGEL